MSPLKIEIMLHYYAFAGDFRDGSLDAPAVQSGLGEMVHFGLLVEGVEPHYSITERGRAYVEALKEVKLPIKETIWVQPK